MAVSYKRGTLVGVRARKADGVRVEGQRTLSGCAELCEQIVQSFIVKYRGTSLTGTPPPPLGPPKGPSCSTFHCYIQGYISESKTPTLEDHHGVLGMGLL